MDCRSIELSYHRKDPVECCTALAFPVKHLKDSLTVTYTYGDGVATDILLRKVLERWWQHFSINCATESANVCAEDLSQLPIAIIEQLSEFNYWRYPSPLKPYSDPGATLLRSFDKLVDVVLLRSDRPLDVHIFAGTNARYDSLIVLINSCVANDEIDVTICGEVFRRSIRLGI